MHLPAIEPEDLARFFLERANAGDVEGIVALYEKNAALALDSGRMVSGVDEIRQFYTTLLSARPQFTPGIQAAAIRNGDIALTSSRLRDGNITAEIARRQPDGSWLWAVDQPAIGKGA
ncbi:MAG: nuclear transport factor 2 family protein [Gammaproteobacteria bacterium]|nr:nuclear transport factor 2 family protein [Gammaproteobacteria bacterium]